MDEWKLFNKKKKKTHIQEERKEYTKLEMQLKHLWMAGCEIVY